MKLHRTQELIGDQIKSLYQVFASPEVDKMLHNKSHIGRVKLIPSLTSGQPRKSTKWRSSSPDLQTTSTSCVGSLLIVTKSYDWTMSSSCVVSAPSTPLNITVSSVFLSRPEPHLSVFMNRNNSGYVASPTCSDQSAQVGCQQLRVVSSSEGWHGFVFKMIMAAGTNPLCALLFISALIITNMNIASCQPCCLDFWYNLTSCREMMLYDTYKWDQPLFMTVCRSLTVTFV